MIIRVLRPVLIGVLVGILGCIAVLLAMAFVASTVDIPPAFVVPLSAIASSFGALSGAFTAARITGRNGWLIGLLTAFLMMILSAVVGVGMYSPVDGGFLLIRSLIMLACGLVGGMVAVNLGKRNKR